ncbi:iron-containing alcohol dehydrogenase [Weissella halotolerans]|uniref:3-dehydroquinate synthase n=1 Tax=Weissella halotolerans DSM 20190 TaxID=1123500 RepID=A0A0R2G7S0_9LACO|nr:iron-containing alcohol dehydrogenase [Weissella halotolerans]KRN33292.1 3-dehydroquinate synthase [Weissella halotolerans DSM 20190]
MKTIEINKQEVAYQIGQDTWPTFGQVIAQCWSPRQVMVVTDDIVGNHYLNGLVTQLRAQGFWVGTLVLPSQEDLKGLAVTEQLTLAFEQAGLGPADGVIALGGGQVLDSVGLASGLYRGGMPMIQIPTTLTAQSELAFRQQAVLTVGQAVNRLKMDYVPAAVLIDVALLDSLSDEEVAAGYASLVALAALAGGQFFSLVQQVQTVAAIRQQALALIQAAWAYQRSVIAEQTVAQSQVLTFGQDFAAALTSLVGSNLRYGETLSIGMVALLDRFSQHGYTQAETTEQVADVLTRVKLPVFASEIGDPVFVKRVIATAGVVNRRISLVGLAQIGQPIVVTKDVQKLAPLILGTAPHD